MPETTRSMEQRSTNGSVVGAFGDVLDATERLALDSLRLARVELVWSIARRARAAVVLMASVTVLLLAWLTAMAVVVTGLQQWVDYRVSLGVISVIHVVGATVASRRALSRLESEPMETEARQ